MNRVISETIFVALYYQENNTPMNEIIKSQIVNAITTAYPGVLFVSVNLSANEMQMHYQTKVVSEPTGKINVSENEMQMFFGMLGMTRVEKIHIFTTEKVVTFYGDGKKVNL